ncbi:TrmB family transcriptional regulator [Salinarchaeum laminariae]|uniref:TrmB family transcriptional regulator n=1 Tax=Salinarchaeum laminariae TaxID=869888 RepID=UPI0020BF5F43|nr:helix-turn-helix domain-containing protein [Salinarchaeum laminariae]
MTALSELGLSSYEEKVYRTLLVTGATTASDLSAASEVPRGRIYDVLNGLESRQLVRSQASEPTRYLAVEPDTAVDRLLDERVRELDRERDRYREVADAARSNLLPEPPADGSVWLGSLGSDAMSSALEEHTRTATDSIHALVGPPYEYASWETLQKEFDSFFDGVATDVEISLIVTDRVLDLVPESFPDLLAAQSASVDVRVRPEIPLSFDVVDRASATIDVLHPRSPADRLGVVGVNEAEIVEELEAQFQACWADAVPLPE